MKGSLGFSGAARGATTVELILFVAAIVVPFGAVCFWLLAMLRTWFQQMESIVGSPF
jgi:hypothetical protein